MTDPAKFFPGFGVPALIPPTQERVEKYTNPDFDYGAYLRDLRKRGPLEGGETQLENIITQCIEGEFAEALAALEAFPREALDDGQQVAYLRLMGGLLETLGDDERSRACLAQALEHSQNLKVAPPAVEGTSRSHTGVAKGQVQVLRRFLRRELSMQLEMQNPFSTRQYDRYEAARRIDAPVFLGYQEYARAVASSYMIEEDYKAALRSEVSSYHRSGMPSEVAWANLAMWMAYSCGDTRRGRFVRVTYGRWAVVHGRRIENHRLVAEGVKELIRSRLTDLKDLFSQVGHLVHALIDVNAYFQNFRPLTPGGTAAEPMWRILNALVSTMVGYASDASLTALRRTYSEGLQRFMNGEPGLAAGTTFSVSYFIEAYNQLGPHPSDLKTLLPWLREREYGPGRLQNLWSLFEEFDWEGHPEAAPIAAQAVEVLETLYPKGEQDAYAPLLRALSVALSDEQRAALDEWAAQHLSPEVLFYYWVMDKHSLARDVILAQLREFVARHTAELRATTPDSPLTFGGPIVPSYIVDVFRNYRDVDADEERVALVRDYLDALTNPHIHARYKVDGYDYLALALEATSDAVKAAIRQTVQDRLPVRERSREEGRGFFSTLGNSIDAQLALLHLRAVVGLFPSQDDLRLLSEAVVASAAYTRRLATDAITVALHGGREEATDLSLALAAQLYTRMFDDNAAVRLRAVTGLMYSGVVCSPTWQTGTLQRAAALIQQDQPFVAASILWTIEREASRLQELEGLDTLTSAGRVNAHRDVRLAADAASRALALTD